MKRSLILFTIVLGSRIANAQIKDTTHNVPILTMLYDTGGVVITFDTLKCIMLCCDTTADDSHMYITSQAEPKVFKIYHRNVWWEYGYEVVTNIWNVHVAYLDNKKRPFKSFVILSK